MGRWLSCWALWWWQMLPILRIWWHSKTYGTQYSEPLLCYQWKPARPRDSWWYSSRSCNLQANLTSDWLGWTYTIRSPTGAILPTRTCIKRVNFISDSPTSDRWMHSWHVKDKRTYCLALSRSMLHHYNRGWYNWLQCNGRSRQRWLTSSRWQWKAGCSWYCPVCGV